MVVPHVPSKSSSVKDMLTNNSAELVYSDKAISELRKKFTNHLWRIASRPAISGFHGGESNVCWKMAFDATKTEEMDRFLQENGIDHQKIRFSLEDPEGYMLQHNWHESDFSNFEGTDVVNLTSYSIPLDAAMLGKVVVKLIVDNVGSAISKVRSTADA